MLSAKTVIKLRKINDGPESMAQTDGKLLRNVRETECQGII